MDHGGERRRRVGLRLVVDGGVSPGDRDGGLRFANPPYNPLELRVFKIPGGIEPGGLSTGGLDSRFGGNKGRAVRGVTLTAPKNHLTLTSPPSGTEHYPQV